MVERHLGSSSGADPTFVAALAEQSLSRKRGKPLRSNSPIGASTGSKPPPPPPGSGAIPISVSVEAQPQQFPTPGVSMEVSTDTGQPPYPGAGGKGITKRQSGEM